MESVPDGASRDTDDALEWLPREIEEELSKPLFGRLSTGERRPRRSEDRGPAEARPARRFEPAPAPLPIEAPGVRLPAGEREMMRRISEVEAAVAEAARAVDLSVSNVRTIVARNGESDKEPV